VSLRLAGLVLHPLVGGMPPAEGRRSLRLFAERGPRRWTADPGEAGCRRAPGGKEPPPLGQ